LFTDDETTDSENEELCGIGAGGDNQRYSKVLEESYNFKPF